MNSLTANDLELWQLWQQGEDSPLSAIPRRWAHFPAGTPRSEVWQWFDQQFSLGLVGTIEALMPGTVTTYNLAIKAWVMTPVEPAIQIGMFESSDDDDWGDSKKTRQSGQNRLF